jgi:hypothetical protein
MTSKKHRSKTANLSGAPKDSQRIKMTLEERAKLIKDGMGRWRRGKDENARLAREIGGLLEGAYEECLHLQKPWGEYTKEHGFSQSLEWRFRKVYRERARLFDANDKPLAEVFIILHGKEAKGEENGQPGKPNKPNKPIKKKTKKLDPNENANPAARQIDYPPAVTDEAGEKLYREQMDHLMECFELDEGSVIRAVVNIVFERKLWPSKKGVANG